MRIAISIENLWKEYRLGVLGYGSLQKDFQSAWARFRGRPDPNAPIGADITANSSRDRIWALRDVSLEVREGEVMGFIGGNGAGKSTLLKILSRVTAPTRGQVKIRGRVASLLEVGTGFHPELTGRENIFLNGAILGMRIGEIKNRFDEIVDFSGVEKFVDTPVKRYSSGMYVRLAFAVAAHLEPEILIVDEVLAVGDADFQKRCLGKMSEVVKGGRTVLFVSHNMTAIETLCSRATLIKRGTVAYMSDDVGSVVSEYVQPANLAERQSSWVNANDRDYANAWFCPVRFYISDSEGRETGPEVSNDRDLWVNIELMIHNYHPALTIGYALYGEDATLLYWTYHTDGPEASWPKLREGVCRLKSRIPKRFLNEGRYRLELIANIHVAEWLLKPGKEVPTIYLAIKGGLSDSPYWTMKRPGPVAPVMEWI
jgi:lipopolysaccharide transport system ATP-binding protein